MRTRIPSGGGRKCRLSFRVTIPVTAMRKDTEAMVNILNLALDGEAATGSDRHFPRIGSLLRSARDNGPHDIARLKPVGLALRLVREEVLNELRALLVIARPAGDGQIAYAVRPAALAAQDVLDLQRHALDVAVGAAPAPLFEEV